MTDGIYGIGYGNTSGVGGGYLPPKKDDVDAKAGNENATANTNQERKDVNPDDVMRFLAQQNYFMPVNVEAKPVANVEGVDAETQERVAGYMERFEEIFALVEAEFGSDLAPQVFDVAMDKLLGMA